MYRLAVFSLVLASAAAAARGQSPASGPDAERAVAALTARLGADDYAAREAATLEIEGLPADALPVVERLLATGDLSPEVVLRVEAKLDLLRRKAAATPYELRLRREWLWDRDAALRAYAAGGHADPRWDAAAREAIVLHVRPRFASGLTRRDDDRLTAAFARAFALGCDDPLVTLFYVSRYRLRPDCDRERAVALMDWSVAGMAAKGYPAFRRAAALVCRAEVLRDRDGGPVARPSAATLRRVTADLDAALALLPELSGDADLPRVHVYDLSFALLRDLLATPGATDRASAVANEDPNATFARVFAVFRQLRVPPGWPALFEANFHTLRAATLRSELEHSPRPDPDYTPGVRARAEAYAQFRRHLESALPLCALAHGADPHDPDAATLMLGCLVEQRWGGADAGAGAGAAGPPPPADRAGFDLWFARATDAYPNNLAACRHKWAFLRAVARPGDALEFARDCAREYSLQSRIPFVLVEAHLAAAGRGAAADEYLGRGAVWDDVRSVFDRYLALYPNAHVDRTLYAKLAGAAGRWRAADAQFKRLGDDAVADVFAGRATLNYLRRKAERLAAAAEP